MTIENEVMALVARKQGLAVEKVSPGMSFYKLGIEGQDGVEILEAFCDQFNIDPSTIDLGRYTIGPEGWGIDLQSKEMISLKWAKPHIQKDLMIRDLIDSAKSGKWFDPSDIPHW